MKYSRNGFIWYGGEDRSDADYCGEGCYWRIQDGTLIISGNGNYEWTYRDDFERKMPPGQNRGFSYDRIVIEKGVKSINSFVFQQQPIKSVEFPNSLIYIGRCAFSGCSLLERVTVHDDGTESEDRYYECNPSTDESGIGDYAFDSCASLKSVVLPNGVSSIGKQSFSGCSSLTSVLLPNGLTEIEVCVFQNCTSLKRIDLPKGITKIGNEAFSCCRSLAHVVVPDGVKEIGHWAFCFCDSLRTINIPQSVSYIGECAFSNCGCLKISVDSNNNTYSEIDGVLFNKNKSKLIMFQRDDCVYTVPYSVIEIESHAFEDCDALTTLVMPESLKEIGKEAFSGCSSLKNVSISNSVARIGEWAFQECTALEKVIYKGSKEKWEQILIEEGNELLCNAVIEFVGVF